MHHHPDLSDPDLMPPVITMLPPPSPEFQAAVVARERATGDGYRAAIRRIADALDLAVLKPTAKRSDVEAACALVNRYGIASVCVASCYVPIARSLTDRVCSVIGFPHGNAHEAAKLREADEAIFYGASELDVVVNYGRFLDGNAYAVTEELKPIVHLAHTRKVIVKAILETCCLSLPQIADLARLCAACGVDYVKTSTGFSTGGADVKGVQCMLDAVGGRCQVKASGGIGDYERAKLFLDMGCTRIGASKYLELLPE